MPVSAIRMSRPFAIAPRANGDGPVAVASRRPRRALMAWAALTTRLRMTWLKSPARQGTAGKPRIEVGDHDQPRISIRCGRP